MDRKQFKIEDIGELSCQRCGPEINADIHGSLEKNIVQERFEWLLPPARDGQGQEGRYHITGREKNKKIHDRRFRDGRLA